MVDTNHILLNYDFVKVEEVVNHENAEPLTFYDIEVEDDHTFHIQFNDQYILSHNCDGVHIYLLMVNMMNEFWPELIELGFIHRLTTPLVIANNTEFFSLSEYNEYKESNTIKSHKYYKGLGSFTAKEFKNFLSDEKYLKQLVKESDKCIEMLDIAFDKSKADERKEWLVTE